MDIQPHPRPPVRGNNGIANAVHTINYSSSMVITIYECSYCPRLSSPDLPSMAESLASIRHTRSTSVGSMWYVADMIISFCWGQCLASLLTEAWAEHLHPISRLRARGYMPSRPLYLELFLGGPLCASSIVPKMTPWRCFFARRLLPAGITYSCSITRTFLLHALLK